MVKGRGRIQDGERTLYLGLHASLGILGQQKASGEEVLFPPFIRKKKIRPFHHRMTAYELRLGTLNSRSHASYGDEIPSCILCMGRNERSHMRLLADNN